ncbi:hypothetical protein JOD45_001557 [Scopulibacillus daqui]|uniref:Uncharacterized protein n=1 Tax=Scopulibacillus daqui TaxID=1469162 RepID=A0ABS2PZ63_9BACL|nr:hypothetical protein [Scopulibacillus daqui]MBM7645346.1 hypothetical protein [Scopulibacillus daqui]
MSAQYFYNLCAESVGETIEVETSDGAVERAMIADLDHNYLYINKFEVCDAEFSAMQNYLFLKKEICAIPLAAIMSLNFMPSLW